jgi:CheY-like chemotaxis protein
MHPSSEARSEVMGRATLILIVDDETDFRTAMREVLEGEGCTVLEAADGKAALVILQDTALPHLILLDLRMPVMNGWDFYAQLQKEPVFAAIPVAILSAVEASRPSGVMHVLHKPIDLPNLLGLLGAIEAPERPSRPPQLHPF